MAFGTGHHETTYLMIQQILNNINDGMKILDLGSGSCILSIVSSKVCNVLIDSVEIDPDCHSNFYENLTLNQIHDNIYYHQKDGGPRSHLLQRRAEGGVKRKRQFLLFPTYTQADPYHR